MVFNSLCPCTLPPEKKVTFKMEGVPEITFEGVRDEIMIQTISAVKAAKLLKRECQGILAVVLKRKKLS